MPFRCTAVAHLPLPRHDTEKFNGGEALQGNPLLLQTLLPELHVF